MSTMTAPERNRYHFDMDQVRQWYEEEGASVREVARRLGTSDRTAWRHMDAAGIRMRPPGGPLPPQRKPVKAAERAAILQAIRDAEETGERQIDIAKRFGRAEFTIRRIARMPEREQRERPSGVIRARYGKVRELHTSGLCGAEIDRELGWKRGRAAHILLLLGLAPKRPTSDRDELAALYEELRFVKAVAAHLGCHPFTASRRLKDAGITVVPRRHSRSGVRAHKLDAHLGAIREARLGPERATIPQLAARYGVTKPTMSGYLDSRGIATYRIVTAEEHDEMLRLRAAGLSKNEIGRRLGRPGITIAKHLRPGTHPRLK